jgi:hypothetical protein
LHILIEKEDTSRASLADLFAVRTARLYGIIPLRATFKAYTNTDKNLGAIFKENR